LQQTEGEAPGKTRVSDKERGKHRCYDANRQRESEPFYRSTRQPEKNRCSKKLSDVGVENRAECFAIRSINRRTERFPLSNFVSEPLVDQNIRIDCDSKAENE